MNNLNQEDIFYISDIMCPPSHPFKPDVFTNRYVCPNFVVNVKIIVASCYALLVSLQFNLFICSILGIQFMWSSHTTRCF